MSTRSEFGLPQLLKLARCPVCFAGMAAIRRRLKCQSGHVYPIDVLGIPHFAPSKRRLRPSERAAAEDAAATYAAMRAYAAEALGRGESEGLYASVSSLVQFGLLGKSPRAILDVGCGTGRTIADTAEAYPAASCIGIDYDQEALVIAYAISRLRGPAVHVDLSQWGFGERVLRARNLSNVFFAQGDGQSLPFAPAGDWQGFDLVTCVNVLDRVAEPASLLAEVQRVLAPSGRFVITTPMNWRQVDGVLWTGCSTLASLRTMVEATGLAVEVAFDGLIYREISDVRGSVADWQVAVLAGRKNSQL